MLKSFRHMGWQRSSVPWDSQEGCVVPQPKCAVSPNIKP